MKDGHSWPQGPRGTNRHGVLLVVVAVGWGFLRRRILGIFSCTVLNSCAMMLSHLLNETTSFRIQPRTYRRCVGSSHLSMSADARLWVAMLESRSPGRGLPRYRPYFLWISTQFQLSISTPSAVLVTLLLQRNHPCHNVYHPYPRTTRAYMSAVM